MRSVRIAAAVGALLALPIFAEQPINQLKGFNATNVYATHDIDSINTFNGNLVLTIPIGQQYPVAAGFSYGLTLVSNWNAWDSELVDGGYVSYPSSRTLTPTAEGLCTSGDGVTVAYPHRRANAGMGWILTLGRLYPPEDPTARVWTYESPDGADHEFVDRLHRDDAPIAGLSYTNDGSYLRMSVAPDGSRLIDFPDGTVHTFEPPPSTWSLSGAGPWMPVRIENHHGDNWLTIAYETNAGGIDWVLRDSQGRVQKVHFVRKQWDGGTDVTRLLVQSVELMAFTPPGQPQRYATYEFEYTQATIPRPDWHERCPGFPVQTTIQQLTAVKLPDDPSTTATETDKYSFTYDNSPLEAPGILSQATLPTGGVIRWTPWTYEKPRWTVLDNAPYLERSVGVGTRTLLDSSAATTGVQWTYQPSLDSPDDNIHPPPREARTLVTDPLGNKVISFFSVAVREVQAPWRLDEYGKPFTPRTNDGSSVPRLLSTVTYPPTVTPNFDNPLLGAMQANFVRYEADGAPTPSPINDNWRLASSRVLTRYIDADDYVDTDSSDFDRFGHYRTVKVSGSSGPSKTTFTNYNPDAPVAPNNLPAAAPWVLGTFSSAKVTLSRPSLPDEFSETKFCFDASTGFLEWKRVQRGANIASNDLLTVFTDAGGNVTAEDYYGGDGAALPEYTCGNESTTSLGTSAYRLTHTYSYGVQASTQYRGMTFKSLDLTIDTTGLPSSSRDTAGVQANYLYNTRGQFREQHPADEAWTEYTYSVDPTADPRATVIARQWAATVSSPPPAGATPLAETRYYYDAFGRLIQQRQKMPGLAAGNLWSASVTGYDALGRAISQSVPAGTALGSYAVLSLPVTSQQYDALGRVIRTTKPDGKIVSVAYKSSNSVERSEEVKTSATGTSQVTVREVYDSLGRLISVVEDALNSPVPTYYDYDEGDRLKLVKDNGNDLLVVQKRTFDYDGAGLLLSEEHPESGATSYLYDSRGHLTRRTEPDANVLTYTYDGAERLTSEKHNNVLLKEYTYDASAAPGDKSLGKMVTATRHNQQPALGGDVAVKETFIYNGLGGRLSSKSTAVTQPSPSSPQPTFTSSYTYDQFGQTSQLTYPGCTNCGGFAAPSRTVTNVYDGTYLRRVAGYTSVNELIGYHANGMLRSLRHLNANGTDGPLYQQEVAADGMTRPSSIDVSGYCPSFRLTVQPPATKTISPGASANINVSAPGATSFEWYRLGESSPIAGQVTDTLSVAVSQNTSFWARAKNGTCTVDSNVSAVSVSSSCSPDATITSASMVNLAATDSASVPATSAAYQWELLPGSNGTITSLTNGPTVSFHAGCSGSLTLKVTVTGSCGAQVSSTRTIEIFVPSFTVTATPSSINQGESSTLSASGSIGNWFMRWAPDGSTEMPHTVTPAVTTTYSIGEVNGCQSTFGAATVTVNSACQPPDATINTPSSVNIGSAGVASVAPAASYLWTISGQGSFTSVTNGSTVTFTAGCSGTLTLTVQTTSSCGATTTSSRTVAINVPTVTASASPQTIVEGNSSTISAAVGGTGPWSVRWSDGSTQPSHSVSPTTTTTYSVTTINGCPATWASTSVTVQPRPLPPTGVTATAVSSNSVSVGWTFTGSVDQFGIDRCTTNCGSAGSWSTFLYTGASPYLDTSAVANSVYVYRVRAIRSGISSFNSLPDVATTVVFSAVATGTTIQALHMTQLRTAVNGIRAAAGSAAMSFTDAQLLPKVAVKAVHFTELQAAINAARTALGLPMVSYSPVEQFSTIRHEHVNELQGAVQ